MKILALISGGKDSIYNLCKCLDEGHQVVALGNLYNPSTIYKMQLRDRKEHNWIAICIKLLELMPL